jgi:hypothetical protein
MTPLHCPLCADDVPALNERGVCPACQAESECVMAQLEVFIAAKRAADSISRLRPDLYDTMADVVDLTRSLRSAPTITRGRLAGIHSDRLGFLHPGGYIGISGYNGLTGGTELTYHRIVED